MKKWGARLLLLAMLVTAALGNLAATAGAADVTVQQYSHATLGPILVDAEGMTLYLFTNDTPGVSNCYGDCEVKWPPLLVDAGEMPTAAPGLMGKLGTTTRKDGSIQVTYDGWPLYYWWEDINPGDTTGQGVGGVWYVVDARPATVMLSQNASHGAILTDARGMTLYRFDKDTANTSACYGACVEKWPPLLVQDASKLIGPEGLPGKLGTTTRTDGKVQVTYNGWPLYYWYNDKQPGDTTGHGFNKLWSVAEAANPTVMLADSETHGQYLAGQGGLTLYVFTKDTPGVSNCSGACLDKWPPLLANGNPVPPVGLKGALGTMIRADGTMQVTYNGLPLYYWYNDKQPGDTTGHEFNKLWFVAIAGLFPDTAGHWAAMDVAAGVKAGWVTGYPDGSFQPQGTVTRAEFIKMITTAFGFKTATGTGSFTDTAGHWSESALETAVSLGVLVPSEYAGGRFEPDRAITREEIAVFAARAAGLKAGDEALLNPFADSGKVSTSARAHVAAAVSAKILGGYPDGTIKPEGTATRGEAVVMIIRALKVVK